MPSAGSRFKNKQQVLKGWTTRCILHTLSNIIFNKMKLRVCWGSIHIFLLNYWSIHILIYTKHIINIILCDFCFIKIGT